MANWRLVISMILIPLVALLALKLSANRGGFHDKDSLNTFPSVSSIFSPTVFDVSNNVTYVGTAHDDVEQYLNIFYAEDTTGKNRFAPPVPYFPAPGSIVDATKSGAWCAQGRGQPLPFTSFVSNISEHCLSLGITRPPSTKADAKLPVLVFIHGGGHALGSYSEQLYRPEGLVRLATDNGKPIIFVGINYRLGVFGFATGKALIKAGHTNAGLRDQREAFEWVRNNIAIFGGDPSNMISLGSSVGAGDTGLHMVSYRGKKGVPFQKAIMMSGGPGVTFNVHRDLVGNNTAAVAKALGCVDGDDLTCLRQVPTEQLMNISVSASKAERPPFGEGFFHPTTDGSFFPERASELLRKGQFVKDIPVIASWVANDGAWYAPPTTSTDQEAIATFGTWLYKLSNATLSKLLKLYPLEDFEAMVRVEDGPISPQYYRAAQMNRDLWFTCTTLDFAQQNALHSKYPGTYLYNFNATKFSPAYQNMVGVPFWRVSHLSDIPYLLNSDVTPGGDNSAVQQELSKILGIRAIDFAYEGRPSISWMPLDATEKKSLSLMYFDIKDRASAVPLTLSQQAEDVGDAERLAALRQEKILERCDFINSDLVREEMGV